LDDVDGDATSINLQNAITTWAADAENLVLYMVDHGGVGNFRMSKNEILSAETLGGWLDNLSVSGKTIVIYDACRSGSFLPILKKPERILISSSRPDQEALFADQGTLSFSYFFWSKFLYGRGIYDAYVSAINCLGLIYGYRQTPQIEADGDGIPDTETDKEIFRRVNIGREIHSGDDFPTIETITPEQTININTPVVLYADNVIDVDGISRVWAAITPPDFAVDSPDTPVTELPSFDLRLIADRRYETVCDHFSSPGTYNIAIFAMDQGGVVSLPKTTQIHAASPPEPDVEPEPEPQPSNHGEENSDSDDGGGGGGGCFVTALFR